MQTLYAHLVDPRFRKDDFRLVAERFEPAYQPAKTYPDNLEADCVAILPESRK